MSYVNPFARAHVTPERIDQGVDYAGSGPILAIGNAVVTQVNPGGWNPYGNYMQYQLTDGPAKGMRVFVAEGINPTVHVGQKISAGDVIANMIPGWRYGIETGWGGSGQDSTYARESGGGYTEGRSTAAGKSFSDFIHKLGAAMGIVQSGGVMGTAPNLSLAGVQGAAAPAGGSGSGGGILDPVGAVKQALSDVFDTLVKDAKYAALAATVIIGGFLLLTRGASRATHEEKANA